MSSRMGYQAGPECRASYPKGAAEAGYSYDGRLPSGLQYRPDGQYSPRSRTGLPKPSPLPPQPSSAVPPHRPVHSPHSRADYESSHDYDFSYGHGHQGEYGDYGHYGGDYRSYYRGYQRHQHPYQGGDHRNEYAGGQHWELRAEPSKFSHYPPTGYHPHWAHDAPRDVWHSGTHEADYARGYGDWLPDHVDRYDNHRPDNADRHDNHREDACGETARPGLGVRSLTQIQESGLTSSSYELSQYMQGCAGYDSPTEPENWSSASAVISASRRPVTPLKYNVPHVRVSFSPGGLMVRVSPTMPSDGEPALVELHSLEVILHSTQEQEEMRAFPGPLVRAQLHKVEVMTFCQRRAEECRQSASLMDRQSAACLWDLLAFLCRHNGCVVGSELAEFLLQDGRSKWQPQSGWASVGEGERLVTVLGENPVPLGCGMLDLLTGDIPSHSASSGSALQTFTNLLLFGRKKEALESAIKSGLWGHALFLASKMDKRVYSSVMSRFMSSLPHSDPLQTLFQLLSGRLPASATSCGDVKWGDWRPHLATILSNQTNDNEFNKKVMVTMGDSLAGRGLLEAAHVCYLMAQVNFGCCSAKTSKLVLLGSNHSLPFPQFATNTAIQCTEVYEYSQRLHQPHYNIPNFQVFKFVYACRLADYGLTAQAFQYCEAIGRALVQQSEAYCTVLTGEVIKLADRLTSFDPQRLAVQGQGYPPEPDWLKQLQILHNNQMTHGVWGSYEHSQPITWTPGSQEIRSAHYTGSKQPEEQLPTARYQPLALGGSDCGKVPEQSPEQRQPFQSPALSADGLPIPHKAPAQTLPAPSGCNGTWEQPPTLTSNVELNSRSQLCPHPHERGSDTAVESMPLVTVSGDGAVSGQHLATDVAARMHILHPRVRTTSEVSSISVEDHQQGTGPSAVDQTRGGHPGQEVTGGASNEMERKGGRLSGWFTWFRSKPAKHREETGKNVIPRLEADTVPFYNPSQFSQNVVSIPRASRLLQNPYPVNCYPETTPTGDPPTPGNPTTR